MKPRENFNLKEGTVYSTVCRWPFKSMSHKRLELHAVGKDFWISHHFKQIKYDSLVSYEPGDLFLVLSADIHPVHTGLDEGLMKIYWRLDEDQFLVYKTIFSWWKSISNVCRLLSLDEDQMKMISSVRAAFL